MTATTQTPEATISRFRRSSPMVISTRSSPGPGSRSASGRAAIREALRPFLALEPHMSGEVEKVLVAGETALVANRWTLTGTQPDGSPVELAGVSADVLHPRPDGSWGIAIDDPWGGAQGGH
jgi:ketosteroid isomerase-like protein